MSVIEIKDLTKDYGNGKGIFHVGLSVEEGEVFGFLGPNGAGKTTTIRNLMGFIKPQGGSCKITGKDCFRDAAVIQKEIGYLAGELAFFDDMTGRQMIQFIADMKGVKDKTRIQELMERFELDPRGKIKKMSKGMKQKIGIVCAFMNDPELIILDEPTSGLDPLMQNTFIDLVLEEKKKGKTIFMSSHIFEEVERTCDRTAIIRQGKIAAIEDMKSLQSKKHKTYVITMKTEEDVKRFEKETYEIRERKGKRISVELKGETDKFLKTLADYEVEDLSITVPTLEEIFLHYYGGEKV